MSRAHEAFLTERLARLDRLIAESEALASRSSDEETLVRISEDIARWREARDGCQCALRRTKSANRFVSWALVTFCTSFAVLCSLAILQPGPILFGLLVASLLLLFGSAIAYVAALLIRDFAAHGGRAWHFSLRSLLAVTTVVALLLGMLAYALRN